MAAPSNIWEKIPSWRERWSGNRIKCEQAQHVIGDIKHYAVNDQESGRNEVNVIIDKRVLHETDLLAFEIGISIGHPAAVMCSYNAVNGDFACENKYLLTDVLKQNWKYPGFVVSDWGGTHSTVKASAAGLDNEEPLDRLLWAQAETGGGSGTGSRCPKLTTTRGEFCVRSLPVELWIIRPRRAWSMWKRGLKPPARSRSKASFC